MGAQMYDLLDALWNAGHGRSGKHVYTPMGALRNNDGYTPLVLAAALGKVDIFNALWARARSQVRAVTP